MTSEVIYLGQLRTEARHIKSGNTIITDAPTDNRGKGAAFSPTDLMATSLASCFLTIMGIKAMDKGIDIEGAKAEVTKIMTSSPRRIEKLIIKFVMPAKAYDASVKKIMEKAAESCPVDRSMLKEIEIEKEIVWTPDQ